ncbi:olfactory receptor 6M1-like [Pelodytes ibericus]
MSLFPVFLLLYIVIISGNVLVIIVIWTDLRLHTPMYFFLAKFSFMEIILSSIVIPKLLINLLSKNKSISFVGCLAQSYFYFLLGTADYILLSVMAYDRYVAICNPFHYSTIMTWNRCIVLSIGCWAGGFASISIPTFLKAQLPFCGPNKINHFFCDSVALMKLACADTRLIQLIDFFLFSVVLLGTLVFVIFTYTCILTTIYHIPSANGQKKAFSTCTSHFSVMSVVYGSSIFIYVTPTQGTSLEVNKILSVVTTFITPVLNPFIFTLRNQHVKEVVFKLMKKSISHTM